MNLFDGCIGLCGQNHESDLIVYALKQAAHIEQRSIGQAEQIFLLSFSLTPFEKAGGWDDTASGKQAFTKHSFSMAVSARALMTTSFFCPRGSPHTAGVPSHPFSPAITMGAVSVGKIFPQL